MKEQSIQLQEISSNNNYSLASDSLSDDDEEVQYTKPTNYCVRDSSESVYEIPPLSANITGSDVVFNFVVFLIVCVNLGADVTLIFYHYVDSNYWGSAVTGVCVSSGGVALLSQFWGVTYDQIHRIYTRGNCVRIIVNGLPWFATVITCYQTTTAAIQSRSNPMITQKYVKLQELAQSFLRVQGFAQGAPQAVVQLVILLEGVDQLTTFKAILLLTSITSSVTMMMISNLPLKTDVISDSSSPKPAAYNPYTRVFIGLRMLSSFFSRTISLSVLFASCRCLIPEILDSSSGLVSHGIPLFVLLIPRILFTIVDYIHTRVKASKQSSQTGRVVKSRFADILVCYLATVFIQFSDPLWVFWYVGVESIAFVVFSGVVEAVLGCVGVGVGVSCVVGFVVLFAIVPFVVPVVGRAVRGRRGVNS